MSTIRVDNARPSAGGTAFSVPDGLAKMTSYFDASSGTPTEEYGYNVASYTDNGVGLYFINYTNVVNQIDQPGHATATVLLSSNPDQTRALTNNTSYFYFVHSEDEPAAAADVSVNHACIWGPLA